jgi:chromosome segregation ATPase
MTDKPDTTREAVERLAQAMEARIFEVYAGHGNVIEQPDPDCNNAATTLRTLAAENDALRAEVAAHSEERMGWNKMLNAARSLKNSLTEKLTKAEAEVAALRQAVERARREGLEEGAQLAMECAYDGFTPAEIVDAIRARAGGAGNE